MRKMIARTHRYVLQILARPYTEACYDQTHQNIVCSFLGNPTSAIPLLTLSLSVGNEGSLKRNAKGTSLQSVVCESFLHKTPALKHVFDRSFIC